MKKLAFTLAEVLITLGIIGVVAALTIPTLMQEQRNKEYVSRFQKAWGLINNAVKLSEAHNGFTKTWDIGTTCADTAFFEKYLNPYFNIAKTCGTNTGQRCWTDSSKTLNDEELPYNDNLSHYKLLLNDGMSLDLCYAHDFSDIGHQIHVAVDTNGPKGPNIGGRDIFKFIVFMNSGQILPLNNSEESKSLSELKEHCLDGTSLPDCGGYLVKNGYKMDY